MARLEAIEEPCLIPDVGLDIVPDPTNRPQVRFGMRYERLPLMLPDILAFEPLVEDLVRKRKGKVHALGAALHIDA